MDVAGMSFGIFGTQGNSGKVGSGGVNAAPRGLSLQQFQLQGTDQSCRTRSQGVSLTTYAIPYQGH